MDTKVIFQLLFSFTDFFIVAVVRNFEVVLGQMLSILCRVV
jgi:hypothetical protein